MTVLIIPITQHTVCEREKRDLVIGGGYIQSAVMMHHCSITLEIKNKTLNFNQADNGPMKDDGPVWARRGAEAISEKR